MRKLVFLSALLLAACAPDRLFPGTPRFLHERGTGRTAADSTLTIPPGEHAWATAVRFPDGYDWELDTCAVDGTVWIDLYCDGTLYKSYPAGASIHPDMHRYAGGHLYTDYSTGTETVVFCDGTECFRFSGRETLRGFVLREDGIHTLGQDRDGDGFTYRIDGREAYRSPTGVVVGDPSRRSGALMFHIMREAERYQVLNTAGIVYDVRIAGGKAYWVQRQRVSLVLMAEGLAAPLHLDTGDNPRSCRIVSGPEGVLVGVNAVRSGVGHSFIQTSGGEVFAVDTGCSLVDILCDGGGTGWLVAGPDGTPARFVRSDGSALALPAGGFLAARDCALLRNGHLYLALSGHCGEPGRLIVDGEVTEIVFNGYFTSVTVE